jgi:type I restriction enzyme M protein
MGRKISRTQIELTDGEIERIASCYRRWRGTEPGAYSDSAGFSKSATTTEIEAASFVLSPGRYVGAPESEEDQVVFEERMATLVDRLAEEMAEGDRLAGEVRAGLAQLGYEV